MTPELSSFRRSRRLRAMTTLWSRLRRTDRRSQPTWTYHRASAMCPREFGRASTLLPIAPSRKARVVGLACIRICPQLWSLSGKPTNEQNHFEIRTYFGRLHVVNLRRNRATTSLPHEKSDYRKRRSGLTIEVS